MVCSNFRKVLLAALVLVSLKMLTHVSARPRDEERTQNEMGWGVGLRADKRSGLYDAACEGEFNPTLYNELDQVCQQCFYLFFDENLTHRCRSNCFHNIEYHECLYELLYPVAKYKELSGLLKNGNTLNKSMLRKNSK